MTTKITPQHLQKTAYIYIRQSTMGRCPAHRHRDGTAPRTSLSFEKDLDASVLGLAGGHHLEIYPVRVRHGFD